MAWDTKFGYDAFAEDDESAFTVPFIENRIPAADSTILPTDALQFDVLHATLECVVEILQSAWEPVHDGIGFVFPYQAGSTVTEHVDPDTQVYYLHFTIRRSGGWIVSPTVRAYPRDTSEREGGA